MSYNATFEVGVCTIDPNPTTAWREMTQRCRDCLNAQVHLIAQKVLSKLARLLYRLWGSDCVDSVVAQWAGAW